MNQHHTNECQQTEPEEINVCSARMQQIDKDRRSVDMIDAPDIITLETAKEVSPAPQIPSSQAAKNQEKLFTAAIQRLSELPPYQYDQLRKSEAESLGVRPATLDAAVKAARQHSSADGLPFPVIEPWPEAVDPAQLLTEIFNTILRFIVCRAEIAYGVALWITMAWFIDVVQVAPLAVITAPEKRCGKSMLLSLIGRLVPKPLISSSISPSALYRSIDAWQPTLLIDEVDACMKDNEELRGLINCGHTRESAFAIRCVGEDHTPKKFNVWGAKALSGIGHVSDTIMDRSIILELNRKAPNEKTERLRNADPELFANLRSKLARFAEDYSDQARQARPPLPESLNDRAQDNWEPLLAIAMIAGNEWLQIATRTALKLSNSQGTVQTVGTQLLSDIREIFENKGDNRIFTGELIQALCADEEKMWATYNRGFQIKPKQIAAKLKAYGIQSKSIRKGVENAKGYTLDQFTEVFSRYIPAIPSLGVTTSQSAPALGLQESDMRHNPVTKPSQPSHNTCNTVTENLPCNPCDSGDVTPNALPTLDCDDVTDKGEIPDFAF